MRNLKKSGRQAVRNPSLNPSIDSPHFQKKDSSFQKKFMSICDLFQSRANESPNSIAVTFHDKKLTYSQLDEKSTQLAIFLRNQGIKPGVVVGLSLRKSEDLIVGIIGIFKAGGIYLPLDPSYPEERLKYMVDDA